ncbi:hypothetical protein DYB37_005065 [Aphanomyces astaci]|uniref:Uncharacterized protein n=1 Tax=Aphanomyces astaci TaxID=112090 RepID=A0A418CZK5_APHAT|nr:hypothetical protein DYB35_010472 [Aphanomyces astaci]RHZ20567.1 hypothetical protein DYB37_005065 [Aphanomyces astaci]
MFRHSPATAVIAAVTSPISDANASAVFSRAASLNVKCSRDDDVIVMVPPSEEYSLTLLRKQLNNIGFDHSRGGVQAPERTTPASSSSPSVHIASLTFVQPTTPPTSPQPKDLLRHHMKTRQKLQTLDSTNCHIMYVDGVDVRSMSTAPAPPRSSCPTDHQYKEGLRKRKSNYMSVDVVQQIDDSSDDVAMDPTNHKSPQHNLDAHAQKLSEFHRDTYGFHALDHGRGNYAACS